MLKPTKHSDPDRTVLAVSTLVLARLAKRRIETFDGLRDFVIKKVDGGDFLFLPAMNFLFLVGVIDYHSKTDSFEFLSSNAT